MGIIRILPSEISGKIAAGEVIERPASVVKELVENSIDANATRIKITIEQGGHKLIQVSDNGTGMEREDAMLCLEAHATSKITENGDVGQIHTLGFRGEALPSISSVSEFVLQTRHKGELVGTEISVSGGKIENIKDCGCPEGTTIKVGYLFGNLPARRKFLKSPATEDAFIEEIVLLLSLSRPNIAFELIMNHKTVFRLPPSSDIRMRTEMLTGKDEFSSMLPVDYQEDDTHIYGYVSKPGFTRNSRREQRIIINGRAAAAETIYFAIRNAYDTLIVKGRYPATVLYIDLPEHLVDVNVHPAKREVRFREPLKISNIVGAALRQALRLGGIAINTTMPVCPNIANPQESKQLPSAQTEDSSFPTITFNPPPVQLPLELPNEPAGNIVQNTNDETNASISTAVETRIEPTVNFTIIGPLDQQYILAKSDNGLVIINVIAAQQRITYERFLANIEKQNIARQQLLLPVTLNLSPADSKLMNEQLKNFLSLGYGIEPFGGHSWLITSIPAGLSTADLAESVRDILTDIKENAPKERQSVIILAQIAAKHSFATKSTQTEIELQHLIHNLMSCRMPYSNPAGLPTMIHITNAELNNRFKK